MAAASSSSAAGKDTSGAVERSDASGTLLGLFSTLVSTPVAGGSKATSQQTGGEQSNDSSTPAKRVQGTDLWWKDFLLRLRQDDAAQLRVFLQGRLREVSMQPVEPEASSPSSGRSFGEVVQRLQKETLVRMQKFPPWADLSEDEWAQTTEAVERFVASQLHDHVLGAVAADREADQQLAERCDILASFVTPEQLGVPAAALDPRFAAAWSSAQDFLHRVAAFKDPRRKLLCIDRCCRQLYRVLNTAAARQMAAGAMKSSSSSTATTETAAESGSGSEAEADEAKPVGAKDTSNRSAPARASADDLVPCVIWCLLRSNPGRLHSHLAFISRFRPSSRIRGTLGYHLTVLRSAVTFVERADAAALGLAADEFDAKLEHGRKHAAERKSLGERLQRLADGHVDDGETPSTQEASSSSSSSSNNNSGGEQHDTEEEPSGAKNGSSASATATAPSTPALDLGLWASAPTAPELPLVPPLPRATEEALAEWREQRFRFVQRDPASLTIGEVSELLEEYRNVVASCAAVAEALGLPPPEVQLLKPSE